MARFYKGVPAGTFFHSMDLRVMGIFPRFPGASPSINNLMQHIARGTTSSCFVSLTRSYGVAEMYAKQAFKILPTAGGPPPHVYEIDIDDPSSVTVLDPIIELAKTLSLPCDTYTYCHDGDKNFLIGVADQAGMATYFGAPVRYPPGSTGPSKSANLSIQLETLVCALRDAEMLVYGTVPAKCVSGRYDVV